MIVQCKGKDLSKISKSKLKDGKYMVSTKRDGNYVQIVKAANNVKFYTSGDKEFYLKDLADALKKLPGSFIVEGEYINTTEGKLGDRPKAAKLTTYRTNFSKGIESNLGEEKIILFDMINSETAIIRDAMLVDALYGKVKGLEIATIEYMTLEEAQTQAKVRAHEGWEGVMCRHIDQMYQPGKRVNELIKIKHRKTADLLCTGINEGEGKYEGMIGSLSLINSAGIEVDVGSGLTDQLRSMPWNYFIGKIIEIEYEQILSTYIQPTFVAVRNDKKESD